MNLLLALVGGVTALFVADYLFRSRARKAAEARGPYSLEDFAASLAGEAVPRHIAAEVYKYFQGWEGVEDFPVHPDDDLYKVYGVWNEDLDDAVLELAEKCCRMTPTTEMVKDMPPVKTVGDVARMVSRLCGRV